MFLLLSLLVVGVVFAAYPVKSEEDNVAWDIFNALGVVLFAIYIVKDMQECGHGDSQVAALSIFVDLVNFFQSAYALTQ